jgi:hypothetical protein
MAQPTILPVEPLMGFWVSRNRLGAKLKKNIISIY